MVTCTCGRELDNGLVLTSHHRRCDKYKREEKEKKYTILGVNYVVCGICSYKSMDLSHHIRDKHSLDLVVYKKEYGPILCSIIDERRKATSLEKHGNKNYRNERARKVAYSVYEGDHPLSDPEVREKQRETKRVLYGDPNYVNVGKRTETNLQRYGVEHYTATEEFQKKAKGWRDIYGSSMKGKIPYNKMSIPPKEDIEEAFRELKTQEFVAGLFDVSIPTLSMWLVSHDIHYEKVKVEKHNVLAPYQVVKEYLDFCRSKSKYFSFYEFGKQDGRGESWSTKLKRVFKPASRFLFYKKDLEKMVYESEEVYKTWLLNFK